MLYLNATKFYHETTFENLTLTSVVFEFLSINKSSFSKEYLTLTSVVFELHNTNRQSFMIKI